MDNINKILVVNLAFIGDVILSTPVIRALKEKYPQSSISMLTIPLTAPIAQLNPYIDKVLIYDKKGDHKGLLGGWKVVTAIKKEKFDMAICMNFAVRGAMLTWLAGIKYRIGYDAQHGKIFLTDAIKASRAVIQHETLNHMMVLQSLGCKAINDKIEIEIPEYIINMTISKINFNKSKKNLIICPFGSYNKKNLEIKEYSKIIQALSDKFDIYIIGGKKEETELKLLAEQAGLDSEKVLAGTLNLQELSALIKLSTVLLSVDTGPMHIAQGVNTPVVALFGPTDPAVWGPRNSHDYIIYKNIECSPCWGKGKCEDNICMEKIDAIEVIAKICEFY